MIRLLIADDHKLMREGLKQLFALFSDLTVADEAADGAELMDRLRAAEADLVLLDMSMPGISGGDLIVRVKAHFPALPILVVSMHDQPLIAQRALRAGANGYVSKDAEPETLLTAVRKVAAGGRFIDPVVAQSMAFEASGLTPAPDHGRLSERELQVLRLLAQGKSVNEIAAELRISSKTVSTHKARMMEKMGFRNNADLMRYALDEGLID
jgi:DNA-binding NarL/FixJ family response regulator